MVLDPIFEISETARKKLNKHTIKILYYFMIPMDEETPNWVTQYILTIIRFCGPLTGLYWSAIGNNLPGT